MSLLGRLVNPAPGENRIANHQFMSVLSEYGRNPFGQTAAVRRTFIISQFGIFPAEEAQLDLFIAEATTQVLAIRDDLVSAAVTASIALKIAITVYSHEVHNILLLAAKGHYTLAQAKTRLNV